MVVRKEFGVLIDRIEDTNSKLQSIVFCISEDEVCYSGSYGTSNNAHVNTLARDVSLECQSG